MGHFCSRYFPHYVNTERDYERDYQATLLQGRTAAGGCKPRYGRGDRKRERSFSGITDNISDGATRVVPSFKDPEPRSKFKIPRKNS